MNKMARQAEKIHNRHMHTRAKYPYYKCVMQDNETMRREKISKDESTFYFYIEDV